MDSVQLSSEQRAAVERTGQDVCVMAGPGSGKTRVLVERFAWLVEQCGADPARILAITFTEKAARMMKRRLVERFEHRPQIREAVERAWVMTIDGFCARLLREHAIEAGLSPDFSVLEESAANRLWRDAAEEALDELFQDQPGQMRRLLEALALSTSDDGRQVDLAASLIEVHEKMRLEGVRELPAALPPAGDAWPEARKLAGQIGREVKWSQWRDWVREFLELPAELTPRHFEVVARFNPALRGKGVDTAKALREDVLKQLAAQWIIQWNAGLPELLREAVSRLDRKYREAKRGEAAADFADLGERAIELLESDAALRERITRRFEYVLMDELQDTNRLQWRLVDSLRRPGRFFAVGDINQSIYGFRHADRTVFEDYRAELREKGHAIDELRENYRSRPEILKRVESALETAGGVEARDLVAMRQVEPLPGPVTECLVAEGDQARETEAELVAARIAEWKARERGQWGDFAILVRTLASAQPFEEALERQGIPFLVSGGRTFLETQETRDIMTLLAALVNPLDEIATAGVLRGPLAGWTDEQLLRAAPEGRSEAFEKLFGGARTLAGFIPPDQMLASILDQCGYWSGLTDRARANIEKLLGWIRRAHRARPRPLAELLEDLEALRDAQGEAEAPPQQTSGAVNIMTIHAAKGLEFPVVFVSALDRRGKQSSPVLLFSNEHGLGAKWRNPATGEALKDQIHSVLSERLKNAENAEEERLLYVAMTRAEDRLVLSYVDGKSKPALLKSLIKAFPEGASGGSVIATESARTTAEVAPLVTLLDAPRVSGQHDSSAAVTDIAQFAACPRKYFLARYVGMEPRTVRPGTGAVELGVEVHRALAGEETESQEARELAQSFRESELGQRMARASRAEREFDFLLAVEDVVLRGQVDAWFEESGELVLLDYKTDRDESAAHEYQLQLRLYALALERYAGRLPQRAALCFLRSGRVVDVSLRKEDLDQARILVRELAAAQNELNFPLKVGVQCRRCWWYGGLCPAKLEEGPA